MEAPGTEIRIHAEEILNFPAASKVRFSLALHRIRGNDYEKNC